MNAHSKLRLSTVLAVTSWASASPGAVIPFSPLPVGVMTTVPARAPAHVGAGDRVPGLFVAQAPEQRGSPGYKRIEILDSKRDAEEFSSKGYVSSRSLVESGSKSCVFMTDESTAPGDAWPALARGEISAFAGSGQNPILGVHVETLEDGSTPGRAASLGIVDAWLDTRTRGLKLVAKRSMPLGTVAEGPLGIRVLAARGDDSVHFVVLPPTHDPNTSLAVGGRFDRAIIESGGDVGVSQCRHSRVSLRALPGTGEHAIVSFQHAERARREAADPEEAGDTREAFATARMRLVQVHLSASRNASPADPVVSVSFRVDSPKPLGS
jgi:hypothetical protein